MPVDASLFACLQVGFEIVTARDCARDPGQAHTWHSPLAVSWNPLDFRFQFSGVGKVMLGAVLRVLEWCWLAPVGTVKVQAMLQVGNRAMMETWACLAVGTRCMHACRLSMSIACCRGARMDFGTAESGISSRPCT